MAKIDQRQDNQGNCDDPAGQVPGAKPFSNSQGITGSNILQISTLRDGRRKYQASSIKQNPAPAGTGNGANEQHQPSKGIYNMHQLIASGTSMTMTSKEIAELVESRHDSVKRTIERLVSGKIIQSPPLVEVENKQSVSPNSKSTAYLFAGEQGKRDSIIVVAQLSPEFTARLVDRWQELEARQTNISTDPLIASLQALQIVRQQQIEHENRLTVLEAKTTTRDESYFTAAGFCNLKGIKLDRASMSMLGKLASNYSREHGLKIGKVYDSRYGEVNEYHVEALSHSIQAEP